MAQAAGKAAQEMQAQQSAAAEQLAYAESRAAELQEQVRALEARAPSSEPRPPVMPGPGDPLSRQL